MDYNVDLQTVTRVLTNKLNEANYNNAIVEALALQQQEKIQLLEAQIAELKATIDELNMEKINASQTFEDS